MRQRSIQGWVPFLVNHLKNGRTVSQFVDQIQWRYELIRPLVLLAEGTPTQRAEETHTHPDTVRTYHLKNSRLKVHALPGCHNAGKWA